MRVSQQLEQEVSLNLCLPIDLILLTGLSCIASGGEDEASSAEGGVGMGVMVWGLGWKEWGWVVCQGEEGGIGEVSGLREGDREERGQILGCKVNK